MQTPETRSINQCTYTPVERKKDGFIPAQPILKRNMLSIVFNDQQTGNVVLDHLGQLQRDRSHVPHPNFEDLASAVKRIWEGDLSTSIKILSKIDIKEVIRFAEDSLEVERSLLKKAQQDLEASISSIAQKTEASTETITQLRNEMASMRESIIAEVKSMVTSVTVSGAVEREFSEKETGEAVRIIRASTIAPPITSTSQSIPEESSMHATITQEQIYAELSQHYPQTTAFLDKLQFFSLANVSKTAPIPLQFLIVKECVLEQKGMTLKTLIESMKVEPIGYLHLERLQFTPIGYERGELVYSLPLLSEETVRVTHREWSRTETEYAKLIATSLETATEEAISEKSELTQSSNTQQQHTSAFNASVTAGYSGSGFNISASVGYNCSDSESSSRQFAAKHAQEITTKASSRAKKDHKISFKVTTAYEVEEQSYREIKNTLQRAVRWDFHRLMKKWRIDLYRYDIRLTYDIVIPEPGSYLLRKYILLKNINDELAKPNPFDISPSSISRDGEAPTKVHKKAPPAYEKESASSSDTGTKGPTSWEALSHTYGVSLDPPPDEYIYITADAEIKFITNNPESAGEGNLEIVLPDGYEFDWWKAWAQPGVISNAFKLNERMNENSNRLNQGAKRSNRFFWNYYWYWNPKIGMDVTSHIVVDVKGKLTNKAFKEWQMQCYERLADAARIQYENKQQRLKQLRDDLLAELNREDALMLRKIEKEELMKGILRWMIGPTFSFYPQDKLKLPELKLNMDGNLEYYDENTQSIKTEYWMSTLQYGEFIKFLHQAIEWENVNYVLYPYFWTYPDKDRWDFKQFLYHNDYVHRSFLRAGAARVVLTIRPGFEKAFLSLMEGELDKLLPTDHEYMSISAELEKMAKTSYPYTQDANVEIEEYLFTWDKVPGNETQRLLRYLSQDLYLSWAKNATIQKSQDGKKIFIFKDENSVEITLEDQKGIAILKITDSRIYDLKVKADDNQLKVYKEANLVDTWYEYTPTGALDVVEGKVLP